jgi:hypothetical protein
MAAAMPKTMMAIRKICRIALSPALISPPPRKTTPEPPKRKMKFRKGAAREPRILFRNFAGNTMRGLAGQKRADMPV